MYLQLNPQFKTYEPLEYTYDICEAVLLWEQVSDYISVQEVFFTYIL